jgi:hypothetical protein
LLEDPDVDSITLSRLAKNASTPLLKLSQEIKRASATEDYPAARLRRMMKGYDRLLKFTEATLALYEEKSERRKRTPKVTRRKMPTMWSRKPKG